ncbi:hypothetical protein AVEN_118917-1 [Araneus ventricosus]|uniref:Uncharacterized protein n=1 Tax=Araneus ventricosus TaxID=182803 RepID=A0A4Y2BX49_ARAVE|nr:hypothetical protein AVEN_118917-1 [Araneus ventricosus]
MVAKAVASLGANVVVGNWRSASRNEIRTTDLAAMEITVDLQDDNHGVQRPTDWPVQGFPQEQGPFFVGGPFDVREGLQAEPAGARAEGGLQEEPGPHAGARLRLQEGLGGLPGNFPEAQVELLIHRPGSQIWTRYPQR